MITEENRILLDKAFGERLETLDDVPDDQLKEYRDEIDAAAREVENGEKSPYAFADMDKKPDETLSLDNLDMDGEPEKSPYAFEDMNESEVPEGAEPWPPLANVLSDEWVSSLEKNEDDEDDDYLLDSDGDE